MSSSRILTVYLTLAALLFGNVTGWVHVGCSSHPAGCCSTNAVNPGETSTGEHGSHSCCHHNHGDTCQADALAHTDKPDEKHDPAQPTEEHDSDRCSICQSFFASRHAIMLADAVVCMERLAVGRELAFIDDLIAQSHLSRSHTVRGPPSV
ncbi:hypothetical protein [Roseimaritima multifibrata]|uniref:hypothetical protein n=1 Tax=Roseimaritima multifibrata TaxID=1930274 RepID=UPI0011A6D79C|nr:hypothetical protein [Roseimaritima multifibrata]